MRRYNLNHQTGPAPCRLPKRLDMKKLVDQLTEKTATFKEMYVEKCVEWARVEHAQAVERKYWNNKDWAEFFGWEYTTSTQYKSVYYGFPRGFYNTKNASKLERAQNIARRISKFSLAEYTRIAEIKAVESFEASILKLAGRIVSKGLDINTDGGLVITHAHVGANFNCTITDGTKYVKAQTILAYGPVQCPHYRYLVK